MRDYLCAMRQRWDETTPKLRLESEIRAGVEAGVCVRCGAPVELRTESDGQRRWLHVTPEGDYVYIDHRAILGPEPE
jgi:hypothetical protein